MEQGQADLTATAPTAGGERLSEDELRLVDAYWRAANYVSVGQIPNLSVLSYFLRQQRPDLWA